MVFLQEPALSVRIEKEPFAVKEMTSNGHAVGPTCKYCYVCKYNGGHSFFCTPMHVCVYGVIMQQYLLLMLPQQSIYILKLLPSVLPKESSLAITINTMAKCFSRRRPPRCRPCFPPVHVNDLQVAGSPFEVGVSAGPARGANATASGSALALATAGKNASFIIQARDGGANPAAEESEIKADEEGVGGTAGTTSSVFNVTLTRIDGVGLDGDQDDSANSTVVYAAVEDIGEHVVYIQNGHRKWNLEMRNRGEVQHALARERGCI